MANRAAERGSPSWGARPVAAGKRRSPITVTDDLRRQAHDLSGTGMTQDAIAKALEIGTGTLSKILKDPRPVD
jgi:DNA invertase Pin-like site-specific DNA recombinase